MIEGIWIRRAIRGDRDAFDRLRSRFQPEVQRYLLHLTGSTTEAEDLAQSTFIKAHGSLPELRNPGAFKGWLFQIAHREFCRWLQGRSPQEAVSSEICARFDLGPDAITLFGAITELPHDLRSAFVAREIQGLSVSETAVVLDIAAGTVKSRCFEARTQLQRKLATSWPELSKIQEIKNDA